MRELPRKIKYFRLKRFITQKLIDIIRWMYNTKRHPSYRLVGKNFVLDLEEI